ncbi:cytosolic carboxypeptidase 3 isoform X10 [Hemicordylus capensis]|uniref:cytosolic carboxypeptidase 3 isoform X10 n=1 Tax=Hemicordylus capensis TaxID=884348 RepID=UPI0023048AA7|nr:cytosolic carboxypeptidase 3 isoform X10 [Hemicordylus capensis]
MSEESNKNKQQTEQLINDGYNSDEDPFGPFLTEDLEHCAFFTDSLNDQLLPRTTQILLEYNAGKWVPRLREPRDLYGLAPAGHLQLVRWPHQYEVIRERIEHIDWTPPQSEPLYIPTGLETEPLCPEPGEGAVVYLADEADKDSSFMYSRIGGSFPSKQVLPQSWEDWDNTLIFEARFESGNLQKVVKIVMEERDVLLYCDLHGHSRKENVFMYGCEKRDQQEERAYLYQRIFPFIMSKNCPDKFSFPDCSFKIQKGKEGTGRVVMWKMGISNSYTLEVTFCGARLGNSHGTHFSSKDLESIGYNFCESLLALLNEKKNMYNECLKELEEMGKQDVNDTVDRDSSSDSSDSNEPTVKPETQVKPRKKCLKTKKERVESSTRRPSKHSHEPLCEAKKSEEPSHRISKSHEQLIKNTQIFQKLKLVELQNIERGKYGITKQDIDPLPRTPRVKKECFAHFWECDNVESQEFGKLPHRIYISANSSSRSSLKGSRSRCSESKTLAGFHELLKESASIVKDSVPDKPANYTVQYLSHYFPEQGLNVGWNDLTQPLKHIISQRLFLPPAILNQMCTTPRRTGALSGCRLPRVEEVMKEAKLRRKTSLIRVEKHPSSVPLSQATGEKHPGRCCAALDLGEKEPQNMALVHGTHFSSPFCKATSWRLEKYQSGRAASCREKAPSPVKGLFGNSRNNSDGKEKESSLPRNARPGRNRGGSQEGSLPLSRSSHMQDFLQLSLPLVSETKYRPSTEKYPRSEPHPKSLDCNQLRLATISKTKGTGKTVLMKNCEDGVTASSSSLRNTRQKMPSKSILCHSESKFFSKRRKRGCLNHGPSVQDLSATTERISFHA